MRAKHTLYQLSYTPLKCLNLKNFIMYFEARLVELVDTSDLKSDSNEEYRFKSDNEYTHNSQNDGIGRHARFRF
jgi:hypothetical protein